MMKNKLTLLLMLLAVAFGATAISIHATWSVDTGIRIAEGNGCDEEEEDEDEEEEEGGGEGGEGGGNADDMSSVFA